MTPVQTPDPNIVVFDDVLADPQALRRFALAAHYDTYTLGLATFHGIALAPSTVPDLLESLGAGLLPRISFFRRSPKGQTEPTFIHTDSSMGHWTALLYLTPAPPDEDGTLFWRDRETGAIADHSVSPEAYVASRSKWFQTEAWDEWYRVQARFNRLLIFSAPYFHSRAMPENYGDGECARLVHVSFGEYAA